jgi:hypothetical protein
VTERNVSLLFTGEQDNGHYDALLPDEEKRKVTYVGQHLETFPLHSSTTHFMHILILSSLVF